VVLVPAHPVPIAAIAALVGLLVAAPGCLVPDLSGAGPAGDRLAELASLSPVPSDLGTGWELVPARIAQDSAGLAGVGLAGNPDFVATPSGGGEPLQAVVTVFWPRADEGGPVLVATAYQFAAADAAQQWVQVTPCIGAQAVLRDRAVRLQATSLDGRDVDLAPLLQTASQALARVANRTSATVSPCDGRMLGWPLGASGSSTVTSTWTRSPRTSPPTTRPPEEDAPGWPEAYVPTQDDAGNGTAPEYANSNWFPNPGPEPSFMFQEVWSQWSPQPVDGWWSGFALADNSADGVHADALRFATAADAHDFSQVYLQDPQTCSYYPQAVVVSGPVAIVLRGFYEPHDGVDTTAAMHDLLVHIVKSLAQRLQATVAQECGWTAQPETTPTSEPSPTWTETEPTTSAPGPTP